MTTSPRRTSASQTAIPPRPPGTDPGTAGDQIRRLRHDGGTYRAIAAAAGLAPGTVHDLATGRRQPTPNTERALRKVTSSRLPRARIDAGGTSARSLKMTM